MSSLSDIQAKCKQVDQEIKSRQEEFGIDLYELLEDNDNNDLGTTVAPSATFLSSFMEEWGRVSEEIDAYAQKNQGKSRKKKRRWSKADRVDSHDTAFEVLGTAAGNSAGSTLSPEERRVNVLVQEAVEDVLQLERLKESYARDVQVTVHGSGLFLSLCGVACC
jgi:hypothetical protein